MVQKTDIDQLERRFQASCNAFVRLAGFSHTGRMIVGGDDCCRVKSKCFFHDFTGMTRNAINALAMNLDQSVGADQRYPMLDKLGFE